jgi:uncharacterized protein UPF0182
MPPPLMLPSSHDDRDYRTRAAGAVARRHVLAHHRGPRRRDRPDPAGAAGDILIDWLWFSATGYLGVFQAIIVAKALIFFVVFVATAIILWVNGSLARRFAQRPWTRRPADFEWKPAGTATPPDLFELIRHHNSHSYVITNFLARPHGSFRRCPRAIGKHHVASMIAPARLCLLFEITGIEAAFLVVPSAPMTARFRTPAKPATMNESV